MPAAVQQVPFNDVDEAVHLLDTEAEPWSIQLEARVAGALEQGRLRSAVGEAMSRHPMARARRAISASGKEHHYYWEITPEAELDPVRVVECPDDEALSSARSELQSRPVPLLESPPLRVQLARHPDGDVVMLNANHAAMDGFGVLRFLRSVARVYGGQPDPVPDIDPLEARNLGALAGTDDTPTKARRAAVLAEKLRDAVIAPSRLASDEGSDEPGYGFHHVRMSEEETAALTGMPVTVNDVLMAAFHLSIAEWNEAHGEPAKRIGIMVPVNMRPPDWQQEVVGNILLPVRVSTDRRDRASLEKALEAVTGQTRRFKEEGTGAALIEVLGRSAALPLGVKEATSPLLSLTGDRLVDTALASNLGRLDDDAPSFGPDVGDITEMWFSAPARMPLGLSVGVLTVAKRMHLSFRYRHPLFGPDAARRFAELYLSTLERYLS